MPIGFTEPDGFLTDWPVISNLNKVEIVDATVEFPTGLLTSYRSGSPLRHLPCSGEDINSHKVPHLAGPPASDSPLWHMPRSGEDINDKKVPYLDQAISLWQRSILFGLDVTSSRRLFYLL